MKDQLHFTLTQKPIPKALVLNDQGMTLRRFKRASVRGLTLASSWITNFVCKKLIWTILKVAFRSNSGDVVLPRHGFICLMNSTFPKNEYFTAADFPTIYEQ